MVDEWSSAERFVSFIRHAPVHADSRLWSLTVLFCLIVAPFSPQALVLVQWSRCVSLGFRAGGKRQTVVLI